MKSDFNVVIMAGGGGTRLWPKSRVKKPKQLYALINQDSLIVNTVKRLLPIVSKENIFVATNVEQSKEIKEHLPYLSKNILIEPFMKNTGPSVGVWSLFLQDKNKPIAFLPADHYVADEKEFQRVLRAAVKIAEKDYLVLIGIRPTEPNTGMGHIKMGKSLEGEVYRVEKFVEKPDQKKAEEYLKSGQYLWNAGMFIAKPKVILNYFKELAPAIYKRLQAIEKNPKSIDKEYKALPNISFDYAIAEKADNVVVLPGDFGWSDVGNWATLLDILSQKVGNNVVVGCKHYGEDTKGCLIHGTDRVVATIGLTDIIVVDTPDAVLVCHKNRAQDVKKIVEKLRAKKRAELL